MDQSSQIHLTGDLAHEIAGAHSDYLAYLATLPSNVRPLVIEMTAPDGSISPGRLSVLALPFWVGEAFDIDIHICRQIALANIFGLLHFITQDHLTDFDFTKKEIPGYVISGTLYLQQMFANYQPFFPPLSPFWYLLNKYWLEWAESTAWEQKVRSTYSFLEEDLLKAARKAAPLKICTSGLALLGHRQDLIPILEEAIDKMHMVFQMSDDLVDMADDLKSDRYNSVVNMLVSRGTLIPKADLEINHIGRVLYTSGDDRIYFERMQEISKQVGLLINRLGIPKWADLIEQTVSQTQLWRDEQLNLIVPSLLDSS